MRTTRAGSTSPSYGQPHTVETYARTATPASRAGGTISENTESVSSIDLLTLARLCASLALRKTAISRRPTASARSRPRAFGHRALKVTPGSVAIVLASSSASASCGTHFGETKLVISIRRRPAATSAAMSRRLPSIGIIAASFWRPSRGLTS